VKTAAVVFAREPVPGRVKTRLAASIGGIAAAGVYAALLENTLAVAAGAECNLVIALAESPSQIWAEDLGLRWEVQRGAELGTRMRNAFELRFSEGCDRVLLVGSDIPNLGVEHLESAVQALDVADVALGPASDGGYWLVAQRRPGLDLFSGIPWSSPDTLAATRRRLEALGATWVELDRLNDLDTEADLRAALADPRLAPALRECLLTALQE
jgi:rSAM/selenodomain-associated transferase 1